MSRRKKKSLIGLGNLKFRPFKNNREGVSNVLGYTFSLSVAAILMASSIFIFNGVVDDKTNEVAKIEAKNIANYVANSIAEAISIKQTMPEADYYKTLDLPSRIAGKKYTIEVTETEVLVKTNDGRITESCSTYSAEGRDSGICSTVINSKQDKITLSYDEMDYIFKFDFSKGNILSHSPVEAGYYMVSPEEGPEWYQDIPYRIPISITNPSYNELKDMPVKIVLNETNFDYDHVTFGSGNSNLDDSNVLQPNLVVFDPDLIIENEINVSASVQPSIWYPHWRYSRINIDNIGPFVDPDDIMEIEKDKFQVILTFVNDPVGPEADSTYVWYQEIDEPPLHPIRFGLVAGSKVECISYTPNYLGNKYMGMAEFYLEDAFTTLPSSLADGSQQNMEIEGYFKDKTKFSIPCSITIKYGDLYVNKNGGGGTYNTIQAAINAATAGKTVYVHGDTYNEKITLNKNINLVGASWGTTIDGTGFNDYVVKIMPGVTKSVINSFTIKNGATGNEFDQTDGLELDGCSNVIVTECEIKDNNGRGVVIHSGANKNIIRKCSILENKGAKVDTKFIDGDGVVITDYSNEDTEYNYVMDSNFKNCNNYDSDGIVIKDGADFNKIENCIITNIGGNDWSKGIDINVSKNFNLAGPSNNVIKDCDISDISGNYIAGIGIWNDMDNDDLTNPTNNKIIGGNIHDIKGLGIALYRADYNIIRNVILHNNYGGIWTLQANNNTIENCKIYDNKDNSFTFKPFLPESKNNGDGIYFDLLSDDNTVCNCDIYNNEGVGIYIADIFDKNPSDNNIIEYCNIYNNGGTLIKNGAILLSFASNTIIRYSNIYDNSRNGISIYFKDDFPQKEGNQIYKNNIFRNGKNGILLLIGTKYNNITNNNFYWNGEYGVKILEVSLTDNNKINNNNFAFNNGENKEAYDGTAGDDDWANNYWEGHSGGPYVIETPLGFPREEDPTPQWNLIPSKIIIIDDSLENLFHNLQNAIDNAIDNAIIKVTGTYKITSPIVIDKPLELIGNNAKIDYSGSDSAIKVKAAGVEIESFDIQGPNQNQYNGILITEGESVIINNCKIHGFGNGIHIRDISANNGVKVTNCMDIYSNTNGIYINGSDNNKIINCKLYNNKNGIELFSPDLTIVPNNNVITECDFDNNENGVYFYSANSNNINCCKFERNTFRGINFDGLSKFNIINKSMIKENYCGIYMKKGSTSNNIYHNHFALNSEYNAYDANPSNSNFWDDRIFRGNYWDDYFGLDTDYNGIGDEPYNIPPNGANKDNRPISAAGRYVQSLRPYSIEYWNPSGESIILVSMDLQPKQNKIIYLYYGSDDIDSPGRTGLDAIAEQYAFKKYVGEEGIFEKGESNIINYEIPLLDDPQPIVGTHTKNETMFVVEARLKINNSQGLKENQVNMILLSQDTPPSFGNSYMVSINTNLESNDNDFYFHKKSSSEQQLKSVNLPTSLYNWLLLRSYIYLSKNCYTTDSGSTYMNFVNISSFIYDDNTYNMLGSITHQQVSVLNENPYLKGYIGIGCGLLYNPSITNGSIIVDWIRIRKAPLVQPIVNIGSMESKNCRWIISSDAGEDSGGDPENPFIPGPLLRDFNCGSIFGIEELPRGTYTISVTSGIYKGLLREEMTVLIDPDFAHNPPTGIASIIFPETTKAVEFETRSTTFDWPGGALEIGFIGCECDSSGPSTGGGIINAITIARGQNSIRLLYER